MTFIGLKDPQQVEDMIAYLKEATKTEVKVDYGRSVWS